MNFRGFDVDFWRIASNLILHYLLLHNPVYKISRGQTVSKMAVDLLVPVDTSLLTARVKCSANILSIYKVLKRNPSN